VSTLESALVFYSHAAFVYYVAFNAIYLVLMVLASLETGEEVHRRTYLGLDEAFRSPLTPGISVLVPAFNEAAVIVPSVRSLLSLHYPRHEVIVVSDGSTDGTVAALAQAFDLVATPVAARDTLATAAVRATYLSRRYHNLVVVDKDNGGRSDALNAALCIARHPYVCVIDADSLLEEDSLLKVAKPVLDAPDLLVATGGTIRVANGCRVDHGRVVEVRLPTNRLAKMQVLEYLRAFLDSRTGWSRLNALGIISGAFGLFHRPLVELVGGYWTETVGEDFELTLRLHRHLRERDEPYRIAFVADPACWTEVPESFGALARQRRRWQRGAWEGMWRHRRMMFNPRFGAVGLLAMPYFLVFEFLSPVFALGGLIVTALLFALGVLTATYFIGFIAVSIGLGILLSLAAVTIEEFGYQRYRRRGEVAQLVGYAIVEGFGFHQLHNVWRLMGCVDLLRGTTGWGAQQRRGFETEAEPVPGALDPALTRSRDPEPAPDAGPGGPRPAPRAGGGG